MDEIKQDQMDESQEAGFRCGYVAIVGRPNVGKSTLLNHLVGQKISITSRKAQTTRHRITGIFTDEKCQLIYVDTPGWQTKHRTAMHQAMNRSVTSALNAIDVVLFVIEAGRYTKEDEDVLKRLPAKVPVVLVINKADRLKEDKPRLLAFMKEMSEKHSFAAIVPVIAQYGHKLDVLTEAFMPCIPEGDAIYDEDQITDRSERFLAAEIVREKIFRLLGDELPYAMNVFIEKFEIEGSLRRIHAAVMVDKPGQKAILIGKGGEKLKRIATEARIDMETLFDGKVFLQVWVKVKGGWADDTRVLREFGFE
ncbi:GTPase Era [Leeia sp. TBRC 13508]|uniref:GTPase Era n=1 Tax=Leeia speluncae TaxID=2884804 RepID=A0ABS8D248_9NEIS|nr:GTPase Era [Leeia speluncae]MCB6182254.1 GTPase Era [Leeia speluncae]